MISRTVRLFGLFFISNEPGMHREVCIDRMEFNADGTIKRVTPTR